MSTWFRICLQHGSLLRTPHSTSSMLYISCFLFITCPMSTSWTIQYQTEPEHALRRQQHNSNRIIIIIYHTQQCHCWDTTIVSTLKVKGFQQIVNVNCHCHLCIVQVKLLGIDIDNSSFPYHACVERLLLVLDMMTVMLPSKSPLALAWNLKPSSEYEYEIS